MPRGIGRRARRIGSFKGRRELNSLVKRGRALAASAAAQASKPFTRKHTALHNQAALKSGGDAADRRVDGERDAAKVTKKIVRTAGKLEVARMAETERGRTYETKDADHRSFTERFPEAKELLAKVREKGWKFVLAVLCAFGISFALDYPVMELLAPSVTAAAFPAPINWVLENFPLVGALCVALGEAALVAYAGREAAWGWSPFQGDPRGLRKSEPGALRGVVVSDRGRASHRVGFVVLALTLLGLLVALVALREKALGLLSGLDGGGSAGGLAAAQAQPTSSSRGFWPGAELFVISSFPLLVAGWAAFIRESPLASSLADLVKAKRRAFKKLARATGKRIALETRLKNLGKQLDLVNLECDADQFLIGLFPHMIAEVLAEASPEFYGVVADRAHPLLWQIDAGAEGSSAEENLADMLAEWRAKKAASGEARQESDDDIGREEAA